MANLNYVNESISDDCQSIDSDSDSQYLTFGLGNDIYGLNVNNIKEIIEIDKIFKIPRTPEYIRGVINLRGEVVPVIDLSSRFYGYCSEISILSNIVIIEKKYKNNLILISMIIDKVEAVIDIKKKNIEPIPEFGLKIRTDFISKVANVNENFIILLNIDNVLNIEELSKLRIIHDLGNSVPDNS